MKTQAILFLLSILLVTACKKSPTGGGDTEPPKVVQTFPDNNSTDVSVDTTLSFAFDEEIDPNSVSVSINDSSAGSFGFSISSKKTNVVVTLEESFDFSTEYIASVTASDLDGNEMDEPYEINFTTEQDTTLPGDVDNTPPSVISVYPEDGAVDVSTTTNHRFEFDERVEEVSYSLESDSETVDGEGEVDVDVFTFAPNEPLDPSTTYTGLITAIDLAGNEMEEREFNFTTAEDNSDNTPPEVTSTTPEDEATDVSPDTDVEATFSEEVDGNGLEFTLENSLGETVEGDLYFDLNKSQKTSRDKINKNRINSAFVGENKDIKDKKSTPSSNFNSTISTQKNVSSNGNKISFVPNSSLSYSTTYTAEVNVVDLNGNEASHSWSFTTADEPDNTPPEVTSTTPEDEATNVSIDTDVSASFNEYIDNNDSELILNSSSDENVEGNISFDDNAIHLAPSNSLNYSTTYTAEVNVVDLNGNEASHSWSFTTADEPDNTPPEVTSSTPENNATDVSIDTGISINLNEPIDSENSQLQLKIDGEDVAGNVSFGESSISFNPDNSLEYSEDYNVQSVVADLAGNETEHNWSFTTEDNPDNTPPTVVSTSPYDGELDASLNSITINMSEDIDPESVSSDNVWVENDEGEHLNYEVTVSGDQIKLDHPDQTPYDYDVIKPSSRYFAHIEGVEDLVGNSLQGSYEWDFVNDLWNASYKHEMRFFGAVSDESGVYFNGTIYEDGFYSFFIVKFNNLGILEWLEELPGHTDTSVENLPSPVLDSQTNELYFFSERDRVVYFNRMDIQTREVTSKSFSEIDHANKLSGELVVDDNSNLHFLWSAGQFGSKMLYKIDKNGNKLDEFDFLNSPAHSLSTDGSDLYIATEHDGSDTIVKLDSETLDLIGILSIDSYDGPFPTTIKSVLTLPNIDKQYITGNYEDKPIIVVNDEAEEDINSLQFGDIYDTVVGDAYLDSKGTLFMLVERQAEASLVKASLSGVTWRQELDFRVTGEYEPILLENQDLIFISNWNQNIDLLSASDGRTIN